MNSLTVNYTTCNWNEWMLFALIDTQKCVLRLIWYESKMKYCIMRLLLDKLSECKNKPIPYFSWICWSKHLVAFNYDISTDDNTANRMRWLIVKLQMNIGCKLEAKRKKKFFDTKLYLPVPKAERRKHEE